MTGRFSGRVAIVTGGASGIGAATVERLASEGAAVVIADRQPPEAMPEGCTYEACDVADPAAAARLVDAVVSSKGQLDYLVNCAGTGVLDETPDMDVESWRRVFAVNVDAVFFLCKAAIPHMRRSGRGAIVNIASISGLVGDYGMGAYNASKSALVNYTRALAIDHAREGIRINALCPGYIGGTGMTRQMSNTIHAQWETGIPMGRAGTAKEMASVVAFLLSDDASYMTGAIVVADGGATAHTGQPSVMAERRRLEAGGA